MSHRQLHFGLNSNVGCLSLSRANLKFTLILFEERTTREAIEREKTTFGSVNGDDPVLLFL